jgi:hypothetical protein
MVRVCDWLAAMNAATIWCGVSAVGEQASVADVDRNTATRIATLTGPL